MSKALSTLRRSRRFTLLLGVAVVMVLSYLATRPPSALAAVLKKQVCTFYSDAAHTTVVGWFHYRCNGSVDQSFGTTSPYSVCDSDWCCGSVWC